MKGNLFQNRWGALSFGCITLIGAVVLVGTENMDGTLAEATAQIEQQSSEYRDRNNAVSAEQPEPAPEPVESEKASPQPSAAPPAEEVFEFTSDEDLQVDPVGIDPTPLIEDPFVDDPAAGEVIEIQE